MHKNKKFAAFIMPFAYPVYGTAYNAPTPLVILLRTKELVFLDLRMLNTKKPYWTAQVLGWTIFFAFQYFLLSYQGSVRYPQARELVFIQSFTATLTGFVISSFLRWAALKFNVLEKKLSSQVLWFLIFIITASFISSIAELSMLKILSAELPKDRVPMENRQYAKVVFGNAFIWGLYFFIWSILYLMYHYIVISKQQEIDTLKLRSLVKELELKTIKAHINPHFIFNALNSIRAMVDEDPQRARTAITELSNILRSGINIDRSERVPLKDELNIIRDYLALEQMRFEDRLNVQYEIDGKTVNQQVPPMMWQMLVENAIKHGISHEMNGGVVKLVAQLRDNYLELMVENTGKLKRYNDKGGFGIKSIYERLKLLYGDNASFEIKQALPGRVIATLRLPVTF